MNPVLSTVGVGKAFGGVQAIQNVSVEAFPGRVLALIGPNGAGKTTFFNALSGIFPPEEGKIFLKGEEVTRLAPHKVCQRGMARTFQNIRLFAEMTVLENVLVGDFCHDELRWADLILRTRRFRQSEQEALERAWGLLRMVGLSYYANLLARNLSYGFQRRLEIARALATRPQALLLDEPGAGMNPTELKELMKIIREIKKSGLAVLLIEHHMKMVMEIADEVIVLDHGEEIARGKPKEISANPQVVSAYLGDALKE